MKKEFSRKFIIPIIVGLITITIFACLKSSFHMDELYSYSFANGDGFLFNNIKEISDENGTYDLLTKSDIIDVLTVTKEEDAFQFKKIIDNCTKDVHPPLYFWILNIVSSIFSFGFFSKWPGLILNIIFYLLTLFLLYKTIDRLFNKQTIALCVTILYGISPIGLSSMLMIRMYCLLSLFAVILIYLTVLHYKSDALYIYLFILLTTAIGILTQYLFLVFAIVLGITYFVYQIVIKKYKKAVLYLTSIITGIVLSLFIFPASINTIFSAGRFSGEGSLLRIIDLKNCAESICQYFTIRQFLGSIVTIVAIGLLMIVFITIKISKNGKIEMDENSWLGLVLVIAGVIMLIIIMIISPYTAARYTYLVFPLLYIVLGLLLYFYNDYSDIKIVTCSLIVGLLCVIMVEPGYLYIEEKDYHQTINKYNDKTCMYLGAYKYNNESMMICDATDYMSFDEIMLAQRIDQQSFESIMNKLENVDRLVVFCGINPDIENNKDFVSPFYGVKEIKIIMNRLNINNFKCIHDGDYSKTFLIER